MGMGDGRVMSEDRMGMGDMPDDSMGDGKEMYDGVSNANENANAETDASMRNP